MSPRILFVAPRIPYPPDSGWNQRMFYTLEILASVGKVTLVCYCKPGAAVPEPLGRLCEATHLLERPQSRWPHRTRTYWDLLERYVLSPVPFDVAEFPGQPLADRVASLARHADLIWVVALFVAEWIQAGRDRMIVDFADIEAEKQRRQLALQPFRPHQFALRLDNLKLRRMERRAPTRYAGVTVCSETDRLFFPPRMADRVLVVPNGVPSRLLAEPRVSDNGASLVFVGNMGYGPNADGAFWFAREVLPRVKAAVPRVRLYLVGHDDRQKVRSLHDGKSIIVTGRVDDVIPYVSGATVSVVPIRWGSGTRIKILESLELGTPVVSTTLGAEGLDVVPERHIKIADTPDDFAEAVIGLVRDPAARQVMAAAGRVLVAERYTWEKIGCALKVQLCARLGERELLRSRHEVQQGGTSWT